MPNRIIVTHRVRDYDRWKEQFDAAHDLRVAAGETTFEVLREEHDPNLVVHLAQWSSIAEARAFFESEEVRAIRERAGVLSPTFQYLTVAASGDATDNRGNGGRR
jgi:quinol monooxygenase YgiN